MQLSAADGFSSAAALRPVYLLWLALLLLSAAAGAADPPASAPGPPVGEVTFVQGVATAQRPGAPPRFLQKGEPLFEGEVINTGGTGYTVIGFQDGTKFTLRPNTSFAVERFQQGGTTKESASFRLLKGGMRAVTGLIAKREPSAMQVNTATATIGIRGTSFDARLCEAECAAEQARGAQRKPAAAPPDPVVARIALLTGSAQAIATGGQARALAEGSALFNGDTVRTEKASHAVLAFRDQSKVTVIAESEFKLEDVRFTGPSSDSGNFTVRIVRGGVRALTGLLGKSNPKAVNFGIATAVIGLRGSGLDASLAPLCPPAGECAPAILLTTWQDETELRIGDRVLPVVEGQTGSFTPSSDTLTLVPKPPPFIDPIAPRPDGVPVNFNALFATVTLDAPGPGLHVGMRGEGETVLTGAGGSINLAGDEAGYLGAGQDLPVRVTPNWATIMNGNLPAPEAFDARSTRVLELLNPGDVICEIR